MPVFKRPRSNSYSYGTTQPSQTSVMSSRRGSIPMRRRRPSIRSTRYRLQDALIRVPMSVAQEFTVNLAGGFNGVGFALTFIVRQQDVGYSIGGAGFLFTAPFNNASSLAAVYDEYKIAYAKQRIFFSKNSAELSGTNPGAPLLIGVVDYTDSNALPGFTNGLAYGNHKIMNLGMDNTNGEHEIYGGKLGVQFSVDSSTPIGVRTLGVTKRAPWCRTEATDVEHDAFKYYLETTDTNDVTVGRINFVTTVIVEYRQLH